MIKNKYVESISIKERSHERLFSEEQIRNISALGDVLREIRSRIKREGVISIEDARKKIKSYRSKK